MNTKLIQSLSSFFLGIIGLFCTFLPDEILKHFRITQNEYLLLIIQIIGALYLGFAIANWMSKTILIGGIYGKAMYMGNLAHFLIGGLALLKWNIKNEFPDKILDVVLVGYLIFLLFYTTNLFINPKILENK